jgi:hypothetical protein
MDGLRARPPLRIRAGRKLLLALGTASVVDLLRRIEEVVIRLRRPTDVGEIAEEEQPKLGEDGSAQREHAFLAAFPVGPERAALRVEVADLDSGQLASPNAQEEQAEQREAVARVLGDREESRPRQPGAVERRASLRAGA